MSFSFTFPRIIRTRYKRALAGSLDKLVGDNTNKGGCIVLKSVILFSEQDICCGLIEQSALVMVLSGNISHTHGDKDGDLTNCGRALSLCPVDIFSDEPARRADTRPPVLGEHWSYLHYISADKCKTCRQGKGVLEVKWPSSVYSIGGSLDYSNI